MASFTRWLGEIPDGEERQWHVRPRPPRRRLDSLGVGRRFRVGLDGREGKVIAKSEGGVRVRWRQREVRCFETGSGQLVRIERTRVELISGATEVTTGDPTRAEGRATV